MGPEPAEFLKSVDLIMHTGDVTGPNVLDWLDSLGPMVCVRGNHDLFNDDRFSEILLMEEAGWRIGAAHIVIDFRQHENRIERMKKRAYGTTDLDILIAGDTHFERIEYTDKTLLLNSGSLVLPHNMSVRLGTVAILDVEPDRVRAEIVALGASEGLRNPTNVAHIELTHDGVVAASYDGKPIEVVDGEVRWPGPAPRDQM